MFKKWRTIKIRNKYRLGMFLKFCESTGLRGYAVIEAPIDLKPGYKYSDLTTGWLPDPTITLHIKANKREYDFLRKDLLNASFVDDDSWF